MGVSGYLDSFYSFNIFHRGVLVVCTKGLCFWCLGGFDSFQVGLLRVWTVLTVLTICMGVFGVFVFFRAVLRVLRDCVLRVLIVLTVLTFLGWGVLVVWSLEI